jgi:hypothetical protein
VADYRIDRIDPAQAHADAEALENLVKRADR